MAHEYIDRGTYYEIKDYQTEVIIDESGNISMIHCPYIPKFLVDGAALGFDVVKSNKTDNSSPDRR